ncbi:Uncharacterised protein [Bordetella pertussis]|nr:Uncharacterised protein [Bordetella pertussis]
MRKVCPLPGSTRASGGVRKNGTWTSSGFASALPSSIHACISAGACPSLLIFTVVSGEPAL